MGFARSDQEADEAYVADIKAHRDGCSGATAGRMWASLKFSGGNGYKAMICVLTALCLVVLIWELAGNDQRHWFPLMCEAVINSVLVVDVAMGLRANGCARYWREWVNGVDFTVTTVCVVLFLTLVVRESTATAYDHELSVMDVTFLTFRYLFMLFRIGIMVRNIKDVHDLTDQRVDFASLGEDGTAVGNDDDDIPGEDAPLLSGK